MCEGRGCDHGQNAKDSLWIRSGPTPSRRAAATIRVVKPSGPHTYTSRVPASGTNFASRRESSRTCCRLPTRTCSLAAACLYERGDLVVEDQVFTGGCAQHDHDVDLDGQVLEDARAWG